MLAGLPVIVPDFGAVVAGIVRDADCGLLVDPSDSRAVANALGTLARSPDERRRMGDNGRRSVLEKYNWEAEAKHSWRCTRSCRAGMPIDDARPWPESHGQGRQGIRP